jgi:hypothetical protein
MGYGRFSILIRLVALLLLAGRPAAKAAANRLGAAADAAVPQPQGTALAIVTHATRSFVYKLIGPFALLLLAGRCKGSSQQAGCCCSCCCASQVIIRPFSSNHWPCCTAAACRTLQRQQPTGWVLLLML